MNYTFLNNTFNIKRYPANSTNNLKPWNAGDELILNYLENELHTNPKIVIANDDFGFLTTCLNTYKPVCIINNKTQEYALKKNWRINIGNSESLNLTSPLDENLNVNDIGLIKIPKSLDLFELYLGQIHKSLTENGFVICSFMTKYFTPQLIKIAEKYFEDVNQTKAHKKARLIVLKKKKAAQYKFIHKIDYNEQIIKQYYGVFSASNIDYATQFLIDNLNVNPTENNILDLASGNGVLALMVLKQNPNAQLTLLDDSLLAIESSKLNLKDSNSIYIHDNNLDSIEDDSLDLVISNPPFHFEYEINISVPLGMFTRVERCLKPNGRFLMVANNHLKYLPHLEHKFTSAKVLIENKKFKVYECFK